MLDPEDICNRMAELRVQCGNIGYFRMSFGHDTDDCFITHWFPKGGSLVHDDTACAGRGTYVTALRQARKYADDFKTTKAPLNEEDLARTLGIDLPRYNRFYELSGVLNFEDAASEWRANAGPAMGVPFAEGWDTAFAAKRKICNLYTVYSPEWHAWHSGWSAANRYLESAL